MAPHVAIRRCPTVIAIGPAGSRGGKRRALFPFVECKASFQLHTRMTDTSLSSVVSGLVRAQMGASVSSTVTDEDLDRHVAELILKEAKKKAEQYGQQGVSAYLPQSVLLPFFLYYFSRLDTPETIQAREQCAKAEQALSVVHYSQHG
jgi:hypothetical protein